MRLYTRDSSGVETPLINGNSGGGSGAGAGGSGDALLAPPFRDLAEVYADEITAAGNVWKWLHNRIQDNNLMDIYLGDWFKFTLPTVQGHTDVEFTARIHSIYYTEEGERRIDFICDELLPEPMAWNVIGGNIYPSCNFGYRRYNQVFNNNQWTYTWIADLQAPYLTSKIYHYLNGISGYEPTSCRYVEDTTNQNNTYCEFTYTNVTDYEDNGLFQELPSDMSAVLVDKESPVSLKYFDVFNQYYSGTWTYTYARYYPYNNTYNVNNYFVSNVGITPLTNCGKLWIPTIFDFQINNALNNYKSHDQNSASASGMYADHSAQARTSANNYFNKRLSSVYANALKLKFPDDIDTTVDNYYWLSTIDVGMPIKVVVKKADTGAYSISSRGSLKECYIPLCFTIG